MRGVKLGSKFVMMKMKDKGDGHATLQEEKLLSREGENEQVPKGCLAVYVGENLQRFVIPASYLCQPVFQTLMEKVAEEFGFQQSGGLCIPCDVDFFEEILAVLKETSRKRRRKMIKNLSFWKYLLI